MTPVLTSFLPQALAFMLAVSRIAGFVVVSPFPGSYVTDTQKVTLICVLAWAAASIVSPTMGLRTVDISIAGTATLEFGCGALIGFAFRVLLSASTAVGTAVAQGMELTMASVFDPSIGSSGSAIVHATNLFGMLIAVGLGAHRVAIAYTLESFRVLPVGSSMAFGAVLPAIVRLVSESMSVGVRLAMPVMAVGLSIQFVLAILARAAPSLQIFSLGISIAVGAGGLVFVQSLGEIAHGLGAQMTMLGSTIDSLLLQLRDG